MPDVISFFFFFFGGGGVYGSVLAWSKHAMCLHNDPNPSHLQLTTTHTHILTTSMLALRLAVDPGTDTVKVHDSLSLGGRAWQLLVANNALVYCAHPLPLFFAATRMVGTNLDALLHPGVSRWLPCPANMIALLVFTYVSLAVISVVVRRIPLINRCFFRPSSDIKWE